MTYKVSIFQADSYPDQSWNVIFLPGHLGWLDTFRWNFSFNYSTLLQEEKSFRIFQVNMNCITR